MSKQLDTLTYKINRFIKKIWELISRCMCPSIGYKRK